MPKNPKRDRAQVVRQLQAALRNQGKDQVRAQIGARVRELRGELNLTQAALGEAIGKTQGWVAELEQGKRPLQHCDLLALALVGGKPVGWLYGIDAPKRKR